MELARQELRSLLSSPEPLWPAGADLTEANLVNAILGQATGEESMV